MDLNFWLRDTAIFLTLKNMPRDTAIREVKQGIVELENAIANLAEGDRRDPDIELSLKRHRKVLRQLEG